MMRRIVTVSLLSISFSLFAVAPLFAFALEPQLIATTTTTIVSPESVTAYYGTLSGEPHRYLIETTKPFTLSLRVIEADVPESKRDISVTVLDTSAPNDPLAALSGIDFNWKQKTDVDGKSYLEGPMWSQELMAGSYEIRISSADNDSSYGLIIGEPVQGLAPVAVIISLILLAAVIWGIIELSKHVRKGKTPSPPRPGIKTTVETTFLQKKTITK